MDQMCTVIAYFHAKPEKQQELEKILQDSVVQTRQEPGRINYHLHQSEDDPNVFVFYENWRSRRDWDLHNQKPFLRSFLDKRTDYLTKDVEVKTYNDAESEGQNSTESRRIKLSDPNHHREPINL